MEKGKMDKAVNIEENTFKKPFIIVEPKPKEKKADGIVSYYTSPLALHKQYKAKTKQSIFGCINCGNGNHFSYYTQDYVHYLENLLCGGKGS